MQKSGQPVVITGMGVVSPFGVGVEKLWQAVSTNQCAISSIQRFSVAPGMAHLGATIPEACLEEVQHAYAGDLCRWIMEQTLAETCQSAHLALDQLPTLGRGIVFFSNHFDADVHQRTLKEHALVTAQGAQQWCLDFWAEWLQVRSGAERGLGVITTCTGSNTAISLSMDWVGAGLADWALVGGMDILHAEVLAELDSVRLLSPSGCRPFARDRDGTVLGDGAGLLLLERADQARKRGAKIWASLPGYGLAADTSGLTRIAADGHFLCQAMTQALQHANLPPEKIGYVNAAATGSPALDEIELLALQKIFPDQPPPISSLKAQIGHSIGASGTLETIVTVLALEHQLLPPTLGVQLAPEYGIDIVPYARPHTFVFALNNAVSMSGHMCTTVLQRGFS